MPDRKVTSQTAEQVKEYMKQNCGFWWMDTDSRGQVSGNGIWKFRDEPLVIHANVNDLPNRSIILSNKQEQELNAAGIDLNEDQRLLEAERRDYIAQRESAIAMARLR